MLSRIFHLHALSALHVGTGQGIGVVDLPIARAKATNLPIVAGSALKGVLRDEQSKLGLDDKQVTTLFGPDNTIEVSHAGALAFGDAHLLILPIRSFSGTVAFATCPFILRQYARDLALSVTIPNLSDSAGVVKNSKLLIGSTQQVALEDLDIQAHDDADIEKWAETIAAQLYPESTIDSNAWQTEFKSRFIVLPDNIFSFLADTATEVRTRIRIDNETRTVKAGALWSEENLPAESVLWGVMGVGNAKDTSKQTAPQLSALLPENELMIQVGGKHTVGRGLCRFILNDSSSANA
ncbi:type III-B CRISPR module RAMP protein Cmr4 [Psychrobacter immobilis]|uniref:type III-B CRISPR module RAMP protein Cmr4 n=1 Tax=Psychrobacter immobilis TaxID=498 RepID=UPI0019182A55|nr:type III-B CRISPR module RAMP protein Cmr4 [Psychrobacter immobilis]